MKVNNPEDIKQLVTGSAAVSKLTELINSEKLQCKRL
jgi:glycine cleavage system H protein